MTTIEQARAMIERLELEESAFYIAGDSDAASTVRGAMRCIQSLITAVEQAEREALEWPAEVTPALHEVLGKPNFWCTPLARTLRINGQKIAEKAEDEQAAVLFWLATLALKHGDGWRDAAADEVKAIRALITGKDK